MNGGREARGDWRELGLMPPRSLPEKGRFQGYRHANRGRVAALQLLFPFYEAENAQEQGKGPAAAMQVAGQFSNPEFIRRLRSLLREL